MSITSSHPGFTLRGDEEQSFFYLTPNIYTSGPELHRIIQSHLFTTLLHTLSLLVTKETVESEKWSDGLAWMCFFPFSFGVLRVEFYHLDS